jgi:hypothetical protein
MMRHVYGRAPRSGEKTYPVPAAVKAAARDGLALHNRYGRGGTDVGLRTATVLSQKHAIVLEEVKKVSEYFPRHAVDNLHDKTSNGWIAWQLWGGDAGRKWSEAIVARDWK